MNADHRDPEPPSGPPAADHDPVTHYEIRVDGHLGTRWAPWFDGLTLTREPDGTTVLAGPVVDQAALHGVLQKLRDLGIGLRSLTPLGPTGAQPPTGPHHPDAPGATP